MKQLFVTLFVTLGGDKELARCDGENGGESEKGGGESGENGG